MLTRFQIHSTTLLCSCLASSALAQAPSWELIARTTTDTAVAGVADAIWVPNSFNNPAIDNAGNVTFSGKIGNFAGTITTANAGVTMYGSPGALNLVARNGSAVLAGGPAGYVFNNTSGVNGLATTVANAPAGKFLVSGSINGPGNSALLDTAVWFGTYGNHVMLARESDACPGTAGAIMSGSFSFSSGTRTNNAGDVLQFTALTGGDTILTGTTANNQAVVALNSAGNRLIFRKGTLCPGLADGTLIGAADAFEFNMNGSGDVQFKATLVAGTGVVTTANDKALFVSEGGVLTLVAREGNPAPGLTDVRYKSTGSFGIPARNFNNSGQLIFHASLEGTAVTTLNDAAIFYYDNGVVTMIAREGDTMPGVADGVVSVFNSTQSAINNNGFVLLTPFMTSAAGTTNCVFGGPALGNKSLILRAGAQVTGLPEGVLYGEFISSFSCGLNNNNELAFTVNLAGAGVVAANNKAFCHWSAGTGVTVLARTGDVGPTGATYASFSPIGATGQNGEGGSCWFSDGGWITSNGADTAVPVEYFIMRIKIAAPCDSDINGDSMTDGIDLALVLSSWGSTGSADVNGDGTVDGADMGVILAGWGACP